MPDSFHSCEITPNGISVKVGTHRRAIGIGDYESKPAFIAAVSALLKDILGDNLALVAANVAAIETDNSAKLAALKAEHAAEVGALRADLETLGTKEEAQAIRKAQHAEKLRASIAAQQVELNKLIEVEAIEVDGVKP